jgi:hypothetical protein
MRIDGFRRTWNVEDGSGLIHALSWRDERGGADLWLTHEDEKYPCLAIQMSGDVAAVFYFPKDRHPGFRCLGGENLPKGGFTKLVFQGCDPGTGENVPNEFIVPIKTALLIAKDFLRDKRMSGTVQWFEL